jgi:16S rRNA processing protein RimM
MAEAGAEYLSVATIRKPHGVRGELAIALETDRPRAVFRPGRVLEVGDASGRPLGPRLTVQKARPANDGMILKAAEFDGRTPELEELRGKTLLIPADQAAPAAAGEVHYRDLVGLRVVNGAEEVGVVREVLETAAGEMLAVRRSARPELLIPFVAAWVKEIDRSGGVLRLELPQGLLEL